MLLPTSAVFIEATSGSQAVFYKDVSLTQSVVNNIKTNEALAEFLDADEISGASPGSASIPNSWWFDFSNNDINLCSNSEIIIVGGKYKKFKSTKTGTLFFDYTKSSTLPYVKNNNIFTLGFKEINYAKPLFETYKIQNQENFLDKLIISPVLTNEQASSKRFNPTIDNANRIFLSANGILQTIAEYKVNDENLQVYSMIGNLPKTPDSEIMDKEKTFSSLNPYNFSGVLLTKHPFVWGTYPQRRPELLYDSDRDRSYQISSDGKSITVDGTTYSLEGKQVFMYERKNADLRGGLYGTSLYKDLHTVVYYENNDIINTGGYNFLQVTPYIGDSSGIFILSGIKDCLQYYSTGRDDDEGKDRYDKTMATNIKYIIDSKSFSDTNASTPQPY
jgi:hypothetical protein